MNEMKISRKMIAIVGGVLVLGTFVFAVLVVRRLAMTPQHLSITAASKITAKQIVKRAKNFIYYEATLHNPPGDNLPDAWDDIILGKIKQLL